MNDIIFNKPLKYAEVCVMFNEEKANGGKGRKLQLEKWNKEFEIEKVGREFIIKREYNEKEKYLLQNDKKFTANIERILLNRIKVSGSQQVTLTYKEIFEGLNLVNKYYYKAKYKDFNWYLENILQENKKEFQYYEFMPNAKDRKIEAKQNMRVYFSKTNNILKRMVKDALDSMQKRDLIIYSRSFKLIKVHKTYIESKYATLEEDSKILSIIDDVKKEFEDKSLFFMNTKEKSAYYDKIDELVNKRMGYDHCHEAIRLIMSKNAIQRDLDKIEEVGYSKKILNDKTFEKLNNSKELEYLMPQSQYIVFNKEFIQDKK